MQKKYQMLLKISVFLTILAIAITMVNYYLSVQTSEKQLKSVSLPLSLNNIYTEIQKNILEPYLISSMMANDTFVKDWLTDPNKDKQKIINYLSAIKEKYQIFYAFLVSTKTKNYYTQDTLLEKLDLNNTKNQWYTDFLKRRNIHEINIDHNTKISPSLNMYINYKILNTDNNVIGVTGVAIKTTYIDKMLKKFREKYNFKVTFFNKYGKTVLKEKNHNNYTSIDSSPLLKAHYNKIISKKSYLFELKKGNETYIIHTKYIEDLNLYLMVEVKLSAYTNNLKTILFFNLLTSFGVVLFVVVVLYRMIQKHSKKLEELAFYDPLTKIYNRRYFETQLAKNIINAKRYNIDFCVVFIDLDDFKHINDMKGHDTGDKVLQIIANLFKDNIRESDIIARFGGDELIILLSNTDIDAGKILVEKLRLMLENSTEIQEILSYNLKASFGISAYKDSDDIDTIAQRADKAMYLSKKKGKNRVSAL